MGGDTHFASLAMAATDILVIAAVAIAAFLLYAWWKNYSPLALAERAWAAAKGFARDPVGAIRRGVLGWGSHSVVNRIQDTPEAREAWAQLRAMMAKYPSGNVPPSEKAEFDRLMKIAYGR